MHAAHTVFRYGRSFALRTRTGCGRGVAVVDPLPPGVVEAVDPALTGVFLGCHPAAAGTPRVANVHGCGYNVFHLDPMAPVVPEVVGVLQDVTRPRRDPDQRCDVLVVHLLAEPGRPEQVGRHGGVASTPDTEVVQVPVVPLEGGLQHFVQLPQHDRRGDLQSPSHRWTDIT
jgi:hypothetical protein